MLCPKIYLNKLEKKQQTYYYLFLCLHYLQVRDDSPSIRSVSSFILVYSYIVQALLSLSDYAILFVFVVFLSLLPFHVHSYIQAIRLSL